ncbi:MAG: DUF5662 family protein [Solobacterium sp.]|jgi:hypothetical protein|nr:DUF5662 family protein [Solobacterium sp.]MCH4223179.1 DUF5662 family protein [Solobacterium sp.]MCH4266027.1 DUF5662 family protein [Solobacterium sp.]
MSNGRQIKLSFIQRLFGHLKTVHTHRAMVRKNCFACGLYRQGLTHDLSKYSPSEFWPSVKYYQGYRSPYAYEKELKGYSPGWLHHKGHNRHHWEYWYDTINGVFQPIEMPYRYLVEMVCDRVAASHTYLKEHYTSSSALEYYLNKKESGYMHPNTQKELEKILRMIAEDGEAAVFARLKTSIQNNQPL